MGRLSDMFGGKRMFVIGVGWLVIWSIIAGLSRRELLLDCARGLSGLGPAAFLPSSVKLLGSVYRPGPRKNLVSSQLHPRQEGSGICDHCIKWDVACIKVLKLRKSPKSHIGVRRTRFGGPLEAGTCDEILLIRIGRCSLYTERVPHSVSHF